jgi:HD-GYP domain-containing protein (c-di-GMP phosphodiesterase class II)
LKQIRTEDLIEHQALPYNIYNENGEKIFEAGKILTPGKLLQLRYFSAIYIDENEALSDKEAERKAEEQAKSAKKAVETEYWEMVLTEDYRVNNTSIIEVQEQLGIKKVYQQAMSSYIMQNMISQDLFTEARDRIIEVIMPIVDNVVYRSQVQLMGDYYQIHSLNVAILSILLATKLRLKETAINDIALASMLHDIGKTKIDKHILLKQNLTPKEQKVLQLHPQIGYKLLKNDFGFPENICRAVLEHHENYDGSGYPYGISDTQVSLYGQIINICNYYDNLISGRVRTGIRNAKDALKIILELGSRNFTSQVLYTFVNMSSYNDTALFKEMDS